MNILIPNEFYLWQSENESSGHPRGGIHLQGALICPSDEDSHTFTVNSSSGEVFKLRATDARARQEWVNKLRSVAEHHSSNFAKVFICHVASTSVDGTNRTTPLLHPFFSSFCFSM